jgi:peptidase M15-like protein
VKQRAGRATWGTVIAASVAAIGVLQFSPAHTAPTEPFAALVRGRLSAGASLNAFGDSREVRFRFALPGADVEFPLEVSGDPSTLVYEWVGARDSTVNDAARPLNGAAFVAPSKPGYYHLAVVRGTERHVIPEPTLAVMVPFRQKVGATLNGYRIGTYLAERISHYDHPDGFLEVQEADVDLKVSTHLRLGDFVTHDGQSDVWPKYVALNPRLLDKLELVFEKLGGSIRLSPRGDGMGLAFDVHSGFRTPTHNRGVWGAASDSRHQYGDAADIAVDADGDGRITAHDEYLVAQAVERVEEEHPDLVGGLGLYTSGLYRTPYVHIDARGTRSRWKG